MLNAFLEVLAVARDELLLFAAVGFLIGGIDDLMVDAFWIARRLWRRSTVYSRFARATAVDFPESYRDRPIVVFVPTWQEQAVIRAMLENCIAAWGDQNYLIYVGCYRNDSPTIAEVARVASARVRTVFVERPGPTTKADCLNALWQALDADQRAARVCARAIVLHDAEDVVHPDELRVFSGMVGRFAMVQIPVEPLRDPRSVWIGGHYVDEFAEAHTRDMVVREAIGAGLPSAGVGCAIGLEWLAKIGTSRGGMPFDEASLTEDYELGLELARLGGRTAFVRMVAAKGRGLVAVRAHFPGTLKEAVRQKARWTVGIALAGWDRIGWTGSIFERWMRFRDRRSLIAALVLVAAYAALALTVLLWFAGRPFEAGQAVSTLLLVNAVLLAWRAAIRATVVTRLHGSSEGLRAVPRMVVSNIVAMMAAWRAIGLYVRMVRTGMIAWDKTDHHFPGLGSVS